MSNSENSLANCFPELLEEWDYEKNYPLTPFSISYGSTKKVFWKCKQFNHSYSISVNSKQLQNIKLIFVTFLVFN